MKLRPDSKIKCAKCGVEMRAGEATLGDEGLCCDACWRARQAKLSTPAPTDGGGAAALGMALGVGALLVGAILAPKN